MLRDKLERIGLNCENATAELADILFEENEKKGFFNDAFNKRISKN